VPFQHALAGALLSSGHRGTSSWRGCVSQDKRHLHFLFLCKCRSVSVGVDSLSFSIDRTDERHRLTSKSTAGWAVEPETLLHTPQLGEACPKRT